MTAELFPSPQNPMAVARRVEPDFLIEGQLTLRHWRAGWMLWRGTHWVEVEDKSIRSRLYRRLEHADFVFVDSKGVTSFKPWSPTKRKVADLLDALGAVTHLASEVDPPSWTGSMETRPSAGTIVACANGLLRVADRELLPHTPQYFNLVAVPFDYMPAAGEPVQWLKFLAELWPDDQESIDALQEFFGYVISGRTDLHKILLIVGPTRSGKGTIARLLTSLIGKGNMAGPTLAGLASNFGLSPLLGKPLAVVSDARLGGSNTEQVVERLLTISGEDTIDVDRKYRDPWTGRLPTRIVILSNELPRFGDSSGTIAHRFLVLSMKVSWLGQENPELTNELATELPGILNWALDGLRRLERRGRFTEPASSIEAVTLMKDTASPTSAFVRECCVTGPDHSVEVDTLYAAWRVWCDDNGYKPGNKAMLSRNLFSTVPRVRGYRPHGEPRRYGGIDLCTPHNPQPGGSSGSRRSEADQQADQNRLPSEPEPLEPPEPLDSPLWRVPACARCGLPLDHVLAEAGETTHPTCQE